MEFNDRAAIVTGAARGVGKGLATSFAAEGIDVAIADIDVETAEEVAASIRADHDGDAVGIECDVTDFESAQGMAEEAIDTFGTVDILVNNAGYWTTKPFVKTDPDDWNRDLGICLEGTLNCTKAVLDHMTANEYGRILNIVSDAGRIGEPHLAVYSGAKAGVIGFGRALSKEVARFDVTVNNLALGVTETPGSADFIESFGKENLVKQYPMSRLGEIDDAVVGALFFVQDEADYVTGQTISVSGGYTTV
jgi:2-hydroxycyclohexanecarboxyl-CoA dehydrogenase